MSVGVPVTAGDPVAGQPADLREGDAGCQIAHAGEHPDVAGVGAEVLDERLLDVGLRAVDYESPLGDRRNRLARRRIARRRVVGDGDRVRALGEGGKGERAARGATQPGARVDAATRFPRVMRARKLAAPRRFPGHLDGWTRHALPTL